MIIFAMLLGAALSSQTGIAFVAMWFVGHVRTEDHVHNIDDKLVWHLTRLSSQPHGETRDNFNKLMFGSLVQALIEADEVLEGAGPEVDKDMPELPEFLVKLINDDLAFAEECFAS